MKKFIAVLATSVLLTAGCSESPQESGGPDAFESRYQPMPSGATLITGATVLTGNGERLDDADVLIRDGKIAAVGTDLDAGDAAGAAAVLVLQWDPAKGPLSPWARVILTAGDIALDYIGTNPGIVGNGSGARLMSAYAQGLADLLPDDGEFGNREDFAQRLFGVFLRAGLDTLAENPEWVVSDDHLQELIGTTVTPVVEAFPDSLADQLRWREVSDAIMGPAASALLNTVPIACERSIERFVYGGKPDQVGFRFFRIGHRLLRAQKIGNVDGRP